MSDRTILPQQSGDVEKLVREQLQRHNLRLKPTETVATLVEKMKADGLALESKFGTLCGKVGDLTADIPGCFETYAQKHGDAFYPRDVTSGIRSRDQLDTKGKTEFIKAHGLQAFENLPRTVEDAGPTELDPSRITASEYAKLPLKTKTECVTAWGSATVAQIMGRKK